MLRRTLPLLTRPLLPQRPPPLTRTLHRTPPRPSPLRDPGGKPNDGSHRTVYDDFHNILDAAAQPVLSISSTSETGFTLQDGLVLSSPIVLLNGQAFMWDPPGLDPSRATPGGAGWEEWAPAVWRLLELVDDRPEILLFGTGRTVLPPPASIRKVINELGIQLDVQNTRNACSTFNLLAEEGRKVAAALLPPIRTPIEKLTPRQLQD